MPYYFCTFLSDTYLKQNAQVGNMAPKMGYWVAPMSSAGLDFQYTITSEIWTHFTFQI